MMSQFDLTRFDDVKIHNLVFYFGNSRTSEKFLKGFSKNKPSATALLSIVLRCARNSRYRPYQIAKDMVYDALDF